MALTADDRKEITTDQRYHDKDTGSAPVQIALITARINYLTEHLRENEGRHRKDHSARAGLLKLVGRRNGLLRYLKNTKLEVYEKTIKDLKLRK
jgi:small subunit ribosomal protein S15